MPRLNLIRIALLAVTLMLASACTYTRAVTQTNVPANRSKPVEVNIKRYIFFATFDDDEIAPLTKRLQEKCPGGRVTGIMTKDLRTLYVWFIFWAREVEATGFCQRGNVADAADGALPLVAEELSEP